MSKTAPALGWVSLALVLLLALGGAASDVRGLWLGIPGLGIGLVAVLAVGTLALWAGVPAGAPLAGLGILVVAVLSGVPLPGPAALAGGPLMAAVLAGLVLVLAVRGPFLPRSAFLPIVSVLYLGAAAQVQVEVGPSGDEPHYLMVADSLWRDGDVALSRDYAEGRYRTFYDRPLEPHYRVRGRGGEIYSVHAVGLSLLILPAYALGGYPAVSFFMALLAALLAREVRELVRDVTDDERLAEGIGWLAALAPPLIHFAGLVFTEVPAALAVTLVLRHGRRPSGAWAAAAWGSALAFLPWLHVRYAALSAVLALYALGARPPRRVVLALAGVAAAAALGLAAYHLALYGTPDPRVVWGRRPEFEIATLALGVPGLLLDQEFGLLAYAPVFVLAAPGLVGLARSAWRIGWTAAGLLLVVLLTAGAWHMWRGGWNPPGRFLVPILPVLALATAAALRRTAGAAAALLVGWSLWTGLAGAWRPSLIHRDRDGTAPFFRAYSGGEEWTRLLPGFVLDETAADRARLALLWGAALLAAAAASLRSRTPPGPGRVAAAALAWLAFAGVASSLSRSRTGGRDAVRLLGRPALGVPAWRLEPVLDARWGPEVLAWGPLYEPHRFPEGAELGRRLALRPGQYGVELDVDGLGGGPLEGWLEVRGDSGTTLLAPLSGFEVPAGQKAVSLALHARGPFLFRQIRLRTQPLSRGPV